MGIFARRGVVQHGNSSSPALSVDQVAKVYAEAIINLDSTIKPEDMPEWKALTPFYRQRVKEAWERARWSGY